MRVGRMSNAKDRHDNDQALHKCASRAWQTSQNYHMSPWEDVTTLQRKPSLPGTQPSSSALVRFAPKATAVLRCHELTRCATPPHTEDRRRFADDGRGGAR